MKKSRYLFILILILSLVAGGLVIWRLFFYHPATPITTPITITPTPSIFLSPTPTQIDQEQGDSEKELLNSLKKRFPLVEFVPFENDSFRIDYQSALTLKVIIKKGTQADIEKAVNNWIESKGVDPATHQIKYLTPELSPAL